MNSLNSDCPWQQTRLRSAGLIHFHYGHRVLAQILGTDEPDDVMKRIYAKVYEKFVQATDAADNQNPIDVDAKWVYVCSYQTTSCSDGAAWCCLVDHRGEGYHSLSGMSLVHEQVFYTIHLSDVGEFANVSYLVVTHLHNVSDLLLHPQVTVKYHTQTAHARWRLNTQTAHARWSLNTQTAHARWSLNTQTAHARWRLNTQTAHARWSLNTQTAHARWSLNTQTAHARWSLNTQTAHARWSLNTQTAHARWSLNTQTAHARWRLNTKTAHARWRLYTQTAHARWRLNTQTAHARWRLNTQTAHARWRLNLMAGCLMARCLFKIFFPSPFRKKCHHSNTIKLGILHFCRWLQHKSWQSNEMSLLSMCMMGNDYYGFKIIVARLLN